MNAPVWPKSNPTNYVLVDKAKGRFLVDKRAFMDQEVFEREREFIFNRCWLYVGHESEVARAGQYLTRFVGQYAILFNRDQDGRVNAFHNLCTHRGTLLSTEKCGVAKSFTCPYHGWTFRANGALAGQNARSGYDETFNAKGEYDLHRVPRLENYRGFYFMNMNPNAVSLEKYLAGAREWIDMIVDQTEHGLEVTPAEQEFHVDYNWKSISENQIDSYHGPTLHVSYFQYAAQRAQESAAQQNAGYAGMGCGLGNGHAGFELGIKTGKPSTDWIPAFGDESRPIIDANRARIIAKYGEERGNRMCGRTRNLLIFPNTILNDVLSLSVRTSFPMSATRTRSNIWNLAPIGEDPIIRKIRLENHLTFVGPGGFAHPDDYEMFDRRAMGDAHSPAFLHDYSKGMIPGDDSDPLVMVGDQADEPQQRAWWTQWDRVLNGAEVLEA
jgi:p-cumate 2,3-dioxygenase alpha subunit